MLLTPVAADVSPLHLICGESLSRLTSAATVRLAQGTDSLRLLRAFASGRDVLRSGHQAGGACARPPASTDKAKSKKRSQFRVASKNIAALYEKMETVEVQPERGCVADQPQRVGMKRQVIMNSKRLETLTCCDWCCAHGRAPSESVFIRVYPWSKTNA